MSYLAVGVDRLSVITESRNATAVSVEHMMSEFTVDAVSDGGRPRIQVVATPETFTRVAAQVLALYEHQVTLEAPGDEELRAALYEDAEATPELQVLAILAPVLFILGHSPLPLPAPLTALIERAQVERLVGV